MIAGTIRRLTLHLSEGCQPHPLGEGGLVVSHQGSDRYQVPRQWEEGDFHDMFGEWADTLTATPNL